MEIFMNLSIIFMIILAACIFVPGEMAFHKKEDVRLTRLENENARRAMATKRRNLLRQMTNVICSMYPRETSISDDDWEIVWNKALEVCKERNDGFKDVDLPNYEIWGLRASMRNEGYLK